jgi:hypothetical protein
MKGTIYGKRLPRGTQVKEGWELLVYWIYTGVSEKPATSIFNTKVTLNPAYGRHNKCFL